MELSFSQVKIFTLCTEATISSKKREEIINFLHCYHFKRQNLKQHHRGLNKTCRHSTNNTSKCIFLEENFSILINISHKFVPQGHTDNIGLDDGLVKNGRQGITWTKDDPVQWR